MPQSTIPNDTRPPAAGRPATVLGCLALTAGLALLGYALFGGNVAPQPVARDEVAPAPSRVPSRAAAGRSPLFERFSLN